MITKVTKENKGQYRTLFEKAGKEYLGDPSAISSLDDYFACLKSLADINPIYTVLPLDEPVFSIDTNTRTITIPEDFRKNGISVQGDEVSEILYFSVDRYTDSMDLFREDIRIAIQWETAPDSKGKTQQGISTEWIRDISSLKQEGKMLFGWAVNSAITNTPGAIKFSVRFYHFDEEQKLDFSLNTLTATAIINPSIDYKFDENGESSVDIIDSSNLIKNRLQDSVTPSDIAQAAEPEFIIDMPIGFITKDNDIEYNSVDLQEVIGEDDQYKFKVQATSDDGGIITYEWYQKLLGSSTENALNASDGVKTEYVLTEDTIYKNDYPYYKLVTDKETEISAYEPVTIASDLIGKDMSDEDKLLLHEKVSTYIAYKAGDYKVFAVNRSGIAKEKKESINVRIPGPDGDTFVLATPDGSEHSYLTDGEIELSAVSSTEQDGDKVNYSWYTKSLVGSEEVKNVEKETTYVDNNTTDTLLINVPEEDRALYDETFFVESHASRNGASTEHLIKTFRVTDPAHTVNVTPQSTLIKLSDDEIKEIGVNINVQVVSDEVTYQWYKLTKDEADDDFPIPGATTPVIKITADPTKAAEDVFNTGSGSYYCEVTNHANNSSASIDSDEISVIPY